MRKLLIKLLLKLLLRTERTEMDKVKRYGIYARLNKELDFIKLMKAEYASIYASLAASFSQNYSDYESGFFAGRLFDRLSILENAENAKENLLNYEKNEQKKDFFSNKVNKLKEEFNEITNKIKKHL